MVKRVQAALVAKFWGFTSGVGKYDLSNDKAEESGQEQQYIVMGLCIITTHSEDLLVIIDLFSITFRGYLYHIFRRRLETTFAFFERKIQSLGIFQ